MYVRVQEEDKGEREMTGLRLIRRGKVRDIYEVSSDRLLIVATDRISAFDFVLPTKIPDKGKVLTRVSRFWFERFVDVPSHYLTCDLDDIDAPEEWHGRAMVVRRAKVIPYEFIVRGYLAGSAWEQYRRDGAVFGHRMPKGLKKGARLPEPILTPTTKAETGHDEPVTLQHIRNHIGEQLADYICTNSIRIYNEASELTAKKGFVLADTKFEWGIIDGKPHIVDELLTPDSSRYWDADAYAEGRLEQFDKQIVRDYLLSSEWDRRSSPPPLPEEIVQKTRQRYITLLNRLTGETL